MRGLEWAAGLFEGEGTIIIRPARKKSKVGNIELSLSSTDQDVVGEFLWAVRVGTVYGPYKYKGNLKPYWKWSVGGDDAASALHMLRPWFCTRRYLRSIEALHAHELRKEQPHYRASREGIGGKPTHKK